MISLPNSQGSNNSSMQQQRWLLPGKTAHIKWHGGASDGSLHPADRRLIRAAQASPLDLKVENGVETCWQQLAVCAGARQQRWAATVAAAAAPPTSRFTNFMQVNQSLSRRGSTAVTARQSLPPCVSQVPRSAIVHLDRTR